MMTFKMFFENEEKRNLLATLSKIPDAHREFVRDYKFKFMSGNTLDGDDEHVGYMDEKGKEIAVAAPWNYPREFTLLHEIGHRVWEHLPDNYRKAWNKVVANTDTSNRPNSGALKQSPEELFSMAYATTYCKNPPVVYYHKDWIEFIKQLPV